MQGAHETSHLYRQVSLGTGLEQTSLIHVQCLVGALGNTGHPTSCLRSSVLIVLFIGNFSDSFDCEQESSVQEHHCSLAGAGNLVNSQRSALNFLEETG